MLDDVVVDQIWCRKDPIITSAHMDFGSSKLDSGAGDHNKQPKLWIRAEITTVVSARGVGPLSIKF